MAFLPKFSPLKLHQNASTSFKYDIVVVGGGIIGAAIAKTLKENFTQTRIALLEKENELGLHQSSHNSHIIHAGLYYEPDSLKAKLCVEGLGLIYKYCDSKKIPVNRNGKLVIAADVPETYRLRQLYKRGIQNQVPGLELLKNWKDVTEIQPCCKGLHALWSPNTGTVDWEIVTKSFGNDFENEKGDIFYNCDVCKIANSESSSYPVLLEDKLKRIFLAKYVVKCLGLYSKTETDAHTNISLKINYKLLNPKLNGFVKTNIYAMPEIEMPFIGIHISPLLNGDVLLGPSAVPALKLDSYSNEIDLSYIRNNLLSPGFARLFLNNFQSCLRVVENAQTLKKYFPMMSQSDILPGPEALQGQLVKCNGELVDDFLIEFDDRIVNCRFVPSPGATSSLAIAKMISKEIGRKYKERFNT